MASFEDPADLANANRRICGKTLAAFAFCLSAMPLVAGQSESVASEARAILDRLATSVPAGERRFTWQVDVSEDPRVRAYATGNGAIVVGRAFVGRLHLDQAQLAMLIAHEMGHIVAGHRRAAPKATDGEGDPAAELQRNALAIAQEDEADAIGFRIATRAGWSADALIGFFEKLAADTAPGELSSTHPSAMHRLERMREAARSRAGR